jgi:hypothetical protein
MIAIVKYPSGPMAPGLAARAMDQTSASGVSSATGVVPSAWASS